MLLEKMGQILVYWMWVGKLKLLQVIFVVDLQVVVDKFKYEQCFVICNVFGGVKFWFKGWLVYFCMYCILNFLLNYLCEVWILVGMRIVIFFGDLNLFDVIVGCWSENDSYCELGDYLCVIFDGWWCESLGKYLWYYLLFVLWVKDLWCEQVFCLRCIMICLLILWWCWGNVWLVLVGWRRF